VFVEQSGEDWAEADPGDAAVFAVGGFLDDVERLKPVDDADHRPFRQPRSQIDVGRSQRNR
jgi:hypothetical protein